MTTANTWGSSVAFFVSLQERLAADEKPVFPVPENCMDPFLVRNRDQIVLEKCDKYSLRKGDIVLVSTPAGTHILRRITAIDGRTIETTGDGNYFRDGRFPKACVRARVSSVIRDGVEISCRSFGWRFKSAVWNALFPVRPFIFKAYEALFTTTETFTAPQGAMASAAAAAGVSGTVSTQKVQEAPVKERFGFSRRVA